MKFKVARTINHYESMSIRIPTSFTSTSCHQHPGALHPAAHANEINSVHGFPWNRPKSERFTTFRPSTKKKIGERSWNGTCAIEVTAVA